MELGEIAAKLRPGTAWNVRGAGNLEQADDAVPRATIPSEKEINDFIAANPIKTPVSADDQIAAIWDYLDTKQLELPQSTIDILNQVKAEK